MGSQAKHMKKYFSEEEIGMANEYVRKHSTLLVIRDLHIKTYSDITSLGKITESDDSTYWQECGARVAHTLQLGV